MKHVLHLASWYPNKTGPQDGDFIQRHLQAIASRMPVHLIFVVKDPSLSTTVSRSTTRNGKLTETIIYYKPFVTGVGAVDRLISFREYNRLLKQEILAYIREHGRPELVHVHVAMRAGIAALYLLRKFGIPYIVSEHWSGYYRTDPDNLFVRNKVFRKYTSDIICNASHVTAVSADLVKQLKEIFGISNTSVIYNVVNTGLFHHQPNWFGKFQFIHISNLHPIKNPGGLLRVLSKLYELRTDWSLKMVGELVPEYQQLAAQLGIAGQIEWIGSVPHTAIPSLINQSQALLLFSNHENLSCVVCESLCSGVPVIATTVGGLPEIVNESNGLLCPPQDEAALLDRILEMMNGHDRFEGASIAVKAAQLFDEQVIADSFISLYESVLRKK